MSFTLLWKDQAPLLKTPSPVLDAEEMKLLPSLQAVLQTAEARLANIEAERMKMLTEAQAQGRSTGAAEARAAAQQQQLALHAQLERERAALRASVARLAMSAVRRIAGEIGPEATVAALAERAVREAAPDQPLKVRVRPEAIESVRRRLAAHAPAIELVGDAHLAREACVIETRFGVIDAGLEQQLGALEAALAQGIDDVAR